MAPPRLSDAERAARRKASKKKWREKQKGAKTAVKNPSSWIKTATKMMEPKHEETNEGPELPGVSLPGFQPTAPVNGDGSGAGPDSAGSGPASSAEGNNKSADASSPPSDKGSDAGKSGEKVDNKEVIGLLAGMYAGALKMGTDYANKAGRPGLPDELIALNYKCMTIILEKQLADTDINSEEAAAYLCVGSSAWVGFQCVMTYREANPPKRTNDPTPEVKTDARASAPTNGTHVNGAGKPPPEQVTGLVIRDAQPKAASGGVYK